MQGSISIIKLQLIPSLSEVRIFIEYRKESILSYPTSVICIYVLCSWHDYYKGLLA